MIKTTATKNKIYVTGRSIGSGVLPFELQPILESETYELFGCEVLYRGSHPDNWVDVDRSLISHLANSYYPHTLFVNLSNQSLMEIDVAELIQARELNDIVIEISESLYSRDAYDAISDRVSYLLNVGMKFAIDDFGAGNDGLFRLYSLERVHMVKIDSLFLKRALERPDAGKILRLLVKEWSAQGLTSIAEGIESQKLHDFAVSLGVDFVQGWHIDDLFSGRGQSLSAIVPVSAKADGTVVAP